jgi:hypothetical protein
MATRSMANVAAKAESEILKTDRNRNNQLCFALVSGGNKTVLVDDLV